MIPNDQIKISELPSDLPILSDFIAKANADGLATKITLQELADLIGNSTGVAPSFEVSLPEGKTLGKYSNGDIVPSFPTIQEQLKDIGQEAIVQLFTEPFVTLKSDPVADAVSYEVGFDLTIELSEIFAQNDAGSEVETKFFKDGVEITLLANETVLKLSEVGNVFTCVTSYNAGTGFKTDNLGNQYPNTIQAGSVVSNDVFFRGYLPIFSGAVTSKPTTPAEVRLLDKRLENSGDVFILNTGTTDKIFNLWMPDGVSIVSIIDLDALNADITGSYISEPFNIIGIDVLQTPINGTLYTMEQGVPYDTNHRHQITIL